MGQTDLDKKVGNEPADIIGTPQATDRADKLADDDKIPVKALPMKQTPTPFKLNGG